MKKIEKKRDNSQLIEGLIGCLSKPIGERDQEELKQMSSLVLRICPLFQQINRNGSISIRQNHEQLEEEEKVMVNILNHATLETFQPSSSLFRIKEKSDRLLIVLEGTVELQCAPKVSSSINEMIVCKILEQGAILGDLDLFLNTARTNTVIARKKTFALGLKKIHFDHYLKPHYADVLTENMNYVFNLKVFEGISNKFGFIKAFFDTFTVPLSFSLQQYVYSEKDSPDFVYFILSGAFLIQKALPSKQYQPHSEENQALEPLPSLEELNLNDHREPQPYAKIYELQKGDFFGEEDIMGNKSHRSSQAICISPGGGELLSIKREIFEKIFLKHYSIEQFFTINLPIKRDFFDQKLLQYSKFLQEHQGINKSSSRQCPQRSTDSVVLPQRLTSRKTPSSQKQISTSQRNIQSIYPSFSSYISGYTKSQSNKRNRSGDCSAEEETTINLKQDSKSSNRQKCKNPGWNSKANSNHNSQICIKITNEDNNESFSEEYEDENKTNNNSRIYTDLNNQETKTLNSVNTLTNKGEVKIKNLRPSSAVQSQLGSVTDLLEFVYSSLEMKQGSSSQEVKQQIRISSEDMCAQMEGESDDLTRKKLALMNIQKEMKETFEFDMNQYIRRKSLQSKKITQLKNYNLNQTSLLSPQKTTQQAGQSQQTDKNIQFFSPTCHNITTPIELKSETISIVPHKEKRKSIDNLLKSKQQLPEEQTQQQQQQSQPSSKKDIPQNEAFRKFQNNLRKICVQYGRSDFLSLKKSLKNHVKDRSFKQIMNENFKSLKDIPSIQYIDNSKIHGRIADKLNFIASSSQNIQPIITEAAQDKQQLEKQTSGSQSQKFINYTYNQLTSPEKLNTEFQFSNNKISSSTKIQNSLKNQQQQQQSKLITLTSSPSSSSIVINKGYIDEVVSNRKNDYLSSKIPSANTQNSNQLTINNFNNYPSNHTGQTINTKNNKDTETKDPYVYSQLIEMFSQKSLDSIETHQSPQRLIPKYCSDTPNLSRPQTSTQKRIQSSKKLAFSCAHMANHRKVLSVPTQPTLSNIEWHDYITTQNNTPKNENLEIHGQQEIQQFQRKSQDAGTNPSSNSHSFQILSPSPQSINPFFPWSSLNSSTPQRERETPLTTQVLSSNILGNQLNQQGGFSQNYLPSQSQRILNFQQNSVIPNYSTPQQTKGQNTINNHPSFSYNSYPTVSSPQNISVLEENQKNPSSFLKLQRSKQINQQERFVNYKEKKQISAFMNMKRANHQQQSLLISPRHSHSPGMSQTAIITTISSPNLQRKKIVFSVEKKDCQNISNKSSIDQGTRSSKNNIIKIDQSEQLQRSQMNNKDETGQIKQQLHKIPSSLYPVESLHSDQPLSALTANLHQLQSSHSFKALTDQNHLNGLNSSSSQTRFSKTPEQIHLNAQSRLKKQLQFVADKQQQLQQEYEHSSLQQISYNHSPISGSKQLYLAQLLSQKLKQDGRSNKKEQNPKRTNDSNQNNHLSNITIDSEQSLGAIPAVAAIPSSTLHTPSNFSSSIQNSPQTGNSRFSSQQSSNTNFSSSLFLQKQYSANKKLKNLHRNSSFFHEQAQAIQGEQLHQTQEEINQSTDEFLRFHSDHKPASSLKLEQFLQSPSSSPSVLKSTLAAQHYAPLHRKALSLFKQQQIQQQQFGQSEQDSKQGV